MTTPTLLPERIYLSATSQAARDGYEWLGKRESDTDIEYVRADIASGIAGVPAQRIAQRIARVISPVPPLEGQVAAMVAIIEEEYSRGIAGQENQDQGTEGN